MRREMNPGLDVSGWDKLALTESLQQEGPNGNQTLSY